METGYRFGVAETLRLVQSGGPAGRVLDAGAGRGHLTGALRAHGFDVTAIDKSEKAVGGAAVRGVEVVRADLLEYEPAQPFDVVILSMVAHHLCPLSRAFDRAVAWLAPKGRLILEDFAVEDCDAATARWFYETRATLGFAGGGDDPLATWKLDHVSDPPLNEGSEIIGALRQRFRKVEVTRAPYFYRYLAAKVGDAAPSGVDVGARLHAFEKTLIELGCIRPLGLRIVASI